ncbi:MAG: hypothetical protein IJQ39_06090, partial [Thermoguttaceae bacterium]|nr:hypothetical protein [Thermoguttaceae bacterium]
PLSKRFRSPPFPAPIGAGQGGDFGRYITIYAVLNPTPKGVGYVLASCLTYFRNPKFIAPIRNAESGIDASGGFLFSLLHPATP